MPQERAEKRIDQLTELSTVNSGVKIPGEYNGEAYYFEAGKLKSLVGISDSVKSALLTLAQKVAYIDENGQTYYDALYAALYPPASVTRITAVFSQGNNVIYDTDSLDTLKQYLVVTASYDDGTSANVTTYTLSGTLTEGTSTITATYGGKAAQFNVTVTHRVWAVTSISAVFNQGSATVYSNQSLDSLRQYLTVNATFENGDTSAVSDYTLSGTLTVGTSTITASYGGKADTFTVTVTEAVATLVSISAVFTQGENVIYEDDDLDTLKPYLVVTAHYDDNTDTVVSDYTLSGTLAVGTSTITAIYGGKTDTFIVTVSASPRVIFTQFIDGKVAATLEPMTSTTTDGTTFTVSRNPNYTGINNFQNSRLYMAVPISGGLVQGHTYRLKLNASVNFTASNYWYCYVSNSLPANNVLEAGTAVQTNLTADELTFEAPIDAAYIRFANSFASAVTFTSPYIEEVV